MRGHRRRAVAAEVEQQGQSTGALQDVSAQLGEPGIRARVKAASTTAPY